MAPPPRPVYYPAMSANLVLRFEEAFLVDPQSLPTPTAVADRVGGGLGGVLSTSQLGALAGQFVGPKKLEALVKTTGDDNLSQIMNIIPMSASAEIQGYRQAGKFTLNFDFRNLPIDPRLIRSIGVEIHLGAIDPADFAAGMAGEIRDGIRASFLPTRTAQGTLNQETLIFQGTGDTIEAEHSDKSSVITISGRDMRGILLDSPISPKLLANLNLKVPIDQVVQQIVDLHPFQFTKLGRRWIVEINRGEWDKGVPVPAADDNVTRVRQQATGGDASAMKPAGEPKDLSFWDIITAYCNLVGAVPYFAGRTVRIRPARYLFDLRNAGFDPTIPTPFALGLPRSVEKADGTRELFGQRRLVYGRDVASLKLGRKLNGAKVPVVEVVSLNTDSTERGAGKLLVVRYPSLEAFETLDIVNAKGAAEAVALQAKAAKLAKDQQGKGKADKEKVKQVKSLKDAFRTGIDPGGENAATDVLRISVPGIKSKEQLTIIAQGLYEEIGRQELGGSCSTKELASLGGDNGDPDLLRLRPGDPIELLTDARALSSRSPLVSEVTNFARMSFAEAVSVVKGRLGTKDDNLARVLVASARGSITDLQSFFRVNNVKFDWDSKSGVSIDFDFSNYVEVRAQMTPDPSAVTTRPTKTGH